MSDPVSNAEVEDVLSSIRRLVSEEKRTPVAAEAPVANDRLVLTPALRVAEKVPTEVAESHDLAAGESDPVLDEQDAEHVEVSTEIWPEQLAEPEPEAQPEEVAHYAGDAHDDAAEDVSFDDHAQDAQPEPIDDIIEHEDIIEAVEDEAEDEADVLVLTPDTSEDTDTPWNSPDMPSIQDAFDDAAQADEVAAAGEAAEDTPEPIAEDVLMAEPMDDVDDVQEMSNAGSLSAKIAALETVIGRTEDQWEPDDTGDSDYSGTEAPAMSWEESETQDDAATAAADTELFGTAEDVLDEEALRDLVSDIVREELQGALGERITRNVRKLVRREIHRALAAQELE